MKSQKIKFVALITLLMGWFSCTNDLNTPQTFKWDASKQQEKFLPINQGKESAYFVIDDNIISFAVPYLVYTKVIEDPEHQLPSILLIMAEGTDVTSLAPIITLAPGVTMTMIHDRSEQVPNQVDYTGIAEVGKYNFRHQIDFTVIAPDGTTVTYLCLAVALGDVLPQPQAIYP